MLDLTTLAIVILGGQSLLILGRALWLVFVAPPDAEPECQDDFRGSMERWGYLRDLRDGD